MRGEPMRRAPGESATAMPMCPKCGEENPQLGAKCPRDEFHYVYEDAVALAEFDPRIGTMSANKYVIVGRISKGGMGAVYRAIQMPVEREVAFKVLRTEMEDSDQGRDRFIREARAISRLTHPNIITLYDFGFEKSGHPYMVMEYAPGTDMGRWLARKDLVLEQVVHVTRQLLGALEEAHGQGIVHRDLKPENIIISPTTADPDYVKLLDFGIARVLTESATKHLTRDGEVFGTPHYMAPEQAQGAKQVGPQADIYAVGVMLYEMISGHPPFDAPTPLAVLMMHLNEPPPLLVPKEGIELPESFTDFIHKAMAKDATQRFADATEMLRALDKWILTAQGKPTHSFRTPFHTPMMPGDLTGETSLHGISDQAPSPPHQSNHSQPVVNLKTGMKHVSIVDPRPERGLLSPEDRRPRPECRGLIESLLPRDDACAQGQHGEETRRRRGPRPRHAHRGQRCHRSHPLQ